MPCGPGTGPNIQNNPQLDSEPNGNVEKEAILCFIDILHFVYKHLGLSFWKFLLCYAFRRKLLIESL